MSINLLIWATSVSACASVALVLWGAHRATAKLASYIRELKVDADGNRALAALAGDEVNEFVVEGTPWRNECRACLSSGSNAKIHPQECDKRCARPKHKHLHLRCGTCSFEWVRELQ